MLQLTGGPCLMRQCKHLAKQHRVFIASQLHVLSSRVRTLVILSSTPGMAASQVESAEITLRVPLETTGAGQPKARLDAYLSDQLPAVSRARLQNNIKEGHVIVNGKAQTKSSYKVRAGDVISYSAPAPTPLEAIPQDIPLDVVYEDDHLIVINKAAGMVVHPSPGHEAGTLVNALLHHCSLPAMRVQPGSLALTSLSSPDRTALHGAPASLPHSSDADMDMELDVDPAADLEIDDDDDVGGTVLLAPVLSGNESLGMMPVIRPGIVHRIDKGTTGLLVVAKDDVTHAHLSEQFKAHTVQRTYFSVMLGCPAKPEGTVQTNVGRDLSDRKKMSSFAFYSTRGRHAISGYKVLEPLADGSAAAVQWQLKTGRTHQIRVHAKYMGHPLFGDDTYGGSGGSAISTIGRGKSARQLAVKMLLKGLDRPALHAATLGFIHPITGIHLQFESDLPDDMVTVLESLRELQ